MARIGPSVRLSAHSPRKIGSSMTNDDRRETAAASSKPPTQWGVDHEPDGIMQHSSGRIC